MNAPFETLMEQHRPMVKRYLSAIAGDTHVADDLTQETFVAAYRDRDRFKVGQDYGAWLRGIARNKARDHHRLKARQQLVVDSRIVEGMEDVFSVFDPPAHQAGLQDHRVLIRKCSETLSPSLKRAIQRVYVHGDSLAEASAALKISSAAVAKRLSRARTLIRHCVNRHLESPGGQS